MRAMVRNSEEGVHHVFGEVDLHEPIPRSTQFEGNRIGEVALGWTKKMERSSLHEARFLYASFIRPVARLAGTPQQRLGSIRESCWVSNVSLGSSASDSHKRPINHAITAVTSDALHTMCEIL